MKLYMTQRSPYARKVRVVAMEKGIHLDCVNQDLTNKTSQLLMSNPLGKVPVLILDNGHSLVDSPVICEYLDHLKPNPLMIPVDPAHKFQILHIAAIADGAADNAVGAVMEKQRHPDNFKKEYIEHQEAAIVRAYQYFETQMPILSELNLASVAVACAVGYINFRLPHLNPQDTAPRLGSWFSQFSLRPSMMATVPVAG